MITKEQNNMPQLEEKTAYEKPSIEIIEMEMEGILCGSGGGGDYNPGGGFG